MWRGLDEAGLEGGANVLGSLSLVSSLKALNRLGDLGSRGDGPKPQASLENITSWAFEGFVWGRNGQYIIDRRPRAA